ncbi:MAG TPA: hypothetical protein VJR89_20950, partial [Polyangiales bacterium]|nr:hypothetical protein [Polyangiales bacterium]
ARLLERGGQCAGLRGASPYVVDTLGLHWGRLRHTCDGELLRHETESPVWFADERAGLIMVGSASRLVAQPPAAVVNHLREPAVATPYAALTAAHSFDAVDRRCLEQAFEPALPPEPGAALELPPLSGEGVSTRPVAWASELAALPVQRLSFVAKRLVYFEADASRRLLAAPVFVAMAM